MSIELRSAIIAELKERIVVDQSWKIRTVLHSSNHDFIPHMLIYHNRILIGPIKAAKTHSDVPYVLDYHYQTLRVIIEAHQEMVVLISNTKMSEGVHGLTNHTRLTYEWFDPGLIENVLKGIHSAISSLMMCRNDFDTHLSLNY